MAPNKYNRPTLGRKLVTFAKYSSLVIASLAIVGVTTKFVHYYVGPTKVNKPKVVEKQISKQKKEIASKNGRFHIYKLISNDIPSMILMQAFPESIKIQESDSLQEKEEYSGIVNEMVSQEAITAAQQEEKIYQDSVDKALSVLTSFKSDPRLNVALTILRGRIDPSQMLDDNPDLHSFAKEAPRWASSARIGFSRAKETGFWKTVCAASKAYDVPSSYALTLNMFETSMGKNLVANGSTGYGAFQYLNKTFIERFAVYGASELSVVQEIDPVVGKKMAALIGVVSKKGNSIIYNREACVSYIGSYAKKWKQESLEERIRQEILSLRHASKHAGAPDVVPTCFAMKDIKVNSSGVLDNDCRIRLRHNYGKRGGELTWETYKNNPKMTMYKLTRKINSGMTSKEVEELMVRNGMGDEVKGADKKLTVGAFIGKVDAEWRMLNYAFRCREGKALAANDLKEALASQGVSTTMALELIAGNSAASSAPVITAGERPTSTVKKGVSLVLRN